MTRFHGNSEKIMPHSRVTKNKHFHTHRKGQIMEVVDNRTFKQKVKDGLLDAKRKAVEVGQWIAKHPMETIGIVTCGVATVSEARRVYDRVDE